MPTPTTAKWPRPKSEDEWEEMVLDAMRLRWGDKNAQRNGRRGQRQDGVDIFGKAGRKFVAAQAKNVDSLSKKEVLDEIAKAGKFRPQISDFYLAIGGPRDAPFQEFIRLLSHSRESNDEFTIHVLFFDDICQELSSDSSLLQKYWGEFLKFSAFVRAIPKLPYHPRLTQEAVLDELASLVEYKEYAAYLDTASNSQVRAVMWIENSPKLEAEEGSIDRSWLIYIGESYSTHFVRMCTIALNIDTGAIKIRPLGSEHWISIDERNNINFLFTASSFVNF